LQLWLELLHHDCAIPDERLKVLYNESDELLRISAFQHVSFSAF